MKILAGGDCGCYKAWADDDRILVWTICADHYVPEDDAKILEGAQNMRRIEKHERDQSKRMAG